MHGERGRTGLLQNVRSFSCLCEIEMRMQGHAWRTVPQRKGKPGVLLGLL